MCNNINNLINESRKIIYLYINKHIIEDHVIEDHIIE